MTVNVDRENQYIFLRLHNRLDFADFAECVGNYYCECNFYLATREKEIPWKNSSHSPNTHHIIRSPTDNKYGDNGYRHL